MTEELKPIRSLTLDNGNTMYVKRFNPYGLWRVNYDKGSVPDVLSGEYTSFDEAMKDITRYLGSKNRSFSLNGG